MQKTRSKSTFPLWIHKGTGQYCKKIKGRFYYFGSDKNEALERYEEELPAILSGCSTPKARGRSDGPTIEELANVYIDALKKRNQRTGKPGDRHIGLSEKTLRRAIRFLGKDCIVTSLGPDQFANLKEHLFSPVPRKQPKTGGVFGRQVERRSPGTVAGEVRRIRTFLNWCHSMEHAPAPRWGKSFSPETEVAHTRASLRPVRKDIAAEDVRKLIDNASPQFRPIVLLGINAGIGNTDIASIEWDDLEPARSTGWMSLPRLKTGADRRFPLWPETLRAIDAYLPMRDKYKGAKYKKIVFLTRRNLPWVRGESEDDRVDSIVTTFTKLRQKAGLQRGTFYDLRRTFRTVAGSANDREAIDLVMGHVKPSRDMGAVYNQHIDNSRIQAICDLVRGWLFG